jgi:hypothetical protein
MYTASIANNLAEIILTTCVNICVMKIEKGLQNSCNPLFLLEAASGFEPLNKGFADLCLTTWLRRRKYFLLCRAGCDGFRRPVVNGANFIQCFPCHVNEENSEENPGITHDFARSHSNLSYLRQSNGTPARAASTSRDSS